MNRLRWLSGPPAFTISYAPERAMKVGLNLGMPPATGPYAGKSILHYKVTHDGTEGPDTRVDVTDGPARVQFDGTDTFSLAGEYINKFGVSQGLSAAKSFAVAAYLPAMGLPDPDKFTVEFVDETPDATPVVAPEPAPDPAPAT